MKEADKTPKIKRHDQSQSQPITTISRRIPFSFIQIKFENGLSLFTQVQQSPPVLSSSNLSPQATV